MRDELMESRIALGGAVYTNYHHIDFLSVISEIEVLEMLLEEEEYQVASIVADSVVNLLEAKSSAEPLKTLQRYWNAPNPFRIKKGDALVRIFEKHYYDKINQRMELKRSMNKAMKLNLKGKLYALKEGSGDKAHRKKLEGEIKLAVSEFPFLFSGMDSKEKEYITSNLKRYDPDEFLYPLEHRYQLLDQLIGRLE